MVRPYLLLFCITLLLFSETGCSRNNRKAIRIKGSDTEVNLIYLFTEAYQNGESGIPFAITGGGSGTGINALINQTTDIANSSRPMSEIEIEAAKKKGLNPIPIVFGMDGLALIVHKDLPITTLNLDQVGAIYRGEISNWQQIGGPNQKITTYGRQSSSGTFIYFRDNVVKADYDQKMRRMNGTAQIVESIRQDPGGIGYVGIGYVKGTKGKPVKGINILALAANDSSKAVSPLISEEITSGNYPLVRPLYQFTNGIPEGQLLEFIRFELSDSGQHLVSEEGYYPVTPAYKAQNTSNGIVP